MSIPVCKKCLKEMVPMEWRLRNGICVMCKVADELGKEWRDGRYMNKE